MRPWCQKTRANQALAGNASENLARVLGIAGGIFDTARWPGAVNAQATCEVRHIAQVLDWALGNYHGANGLTVDKRVALVADVRAKLVPHAQQLISGVRGSMAASMGLDIAGVDAEVRRLRADLESAKERAEDANRQLQQARTELGALRSDSNHCATALEAVKKDLENEGRKCKRLEEQVKDQHTQRRAAHEANRVPEVVSRFLAITAETHLQQPEITGLAVPVSFTLHVPVNRDGSCEYEHVGGVLQEEATSEISMLALETEMVHGRARAPPRQT